MNKIPELKNNWIVNQRCPNCHQHIRDVSFTINIKYLDIRMIICPFCGILFKAKKIRDRQMEEWDKKYRAKEK